MQFRNLDSKNEEPMALGSTDKNGAPSRIAIRENTLLFSGVVLLLLAVSMVASTFLG